MTKYVFVTGGVVSSLGKGIAAASLAAFVVTTNSDDGPGSLRQAILLANAAPGADTVTFNLSV